MKLALASERWGGSNFDALEKRKFLPPFPVFGAPFFWIKVAAEDNERNGNGTIAGLDQGTFDRDKVNVKSVLKWLNACDD